MFGTLGFAEEEFWSSCLKLLVVGMFICIGIVMNCGGGPSSGAYSEYVGGALWHEPGALANGFKGICATFVTAAFSFGELVSLWLRNWVLEGVRQGWSSSDTQIYFIIPCISHEVLAEATEEHPG